MNTHNWIDEHFGSEFVEEHELYQKVWREKLRNKLDNSASLDLAE